VEGLLGNIIKARALLVKGQGQGGSLANSKKGRGHGQICPLFLLLPRWETGEAAQGIGGARPAALGLGDGRSEGEKREGDVGD